MNQELSFPHCEFPELGYCLCKGDSMQEQHHCNLFHSLLCFAMKP